MIIPALLTKDWDRKKYEVCRVARDFLRAHMDKPMIDLTQANPALYAEVDGPLQKVHDVRMKFSMMKVSFTESRTETDIHAFSRPSLHESVAHLHARLPQ